MTVSKKAMAVLALAGCAVAGCGDDGPTAPEPASLSELFGEELYKADGSSVGVGALSGKPLIGIYFASLGCPACGAFTPLLIDTYTQLRDGARSFEVVFVTGGMSNALLFDFMTDAGMPWLALSPLDPKVDALVQRYGIRWVPTLVVIDGSGTLITMDGRDDVTERGTAAYDLWLAASAGS